MVHTFNPSTAGGPAHRGWETGRVDIGCKFHLSLFLSLLVLDRVSLCKSWSCPGMRFIDQAGLKLTEIHLRLPPKCWD